MLTPDSDRTKTEALTEIKERIRARVVVGAGAVNEQTLKLPELPDFSGLRHLSEELKTLCAQIGGVPPEPPTMRGRIGAFLVHLVQRALFWYTPQIRISIDGLARLFQQYLDQLEDSIRFDRQEKELFRKQVADLAVKIANLEARINTREEKMD
jgi:hypothetical protein